MSNLLKQISPFYKGGFSSQDFVNKAGAVIFRNHNGQTEILLVHRLKQNDWSFPKGHVGKHEFLFEAAHRELYEECRLRPTILGQLRDLFYRDSKGGEVCLTMYFGFSLNEEPKKTKKEKAEWINFKDVETVLTYENLRNYWRAHVKPLFAYNRRTPQCDIIYSSKEPYLPAIRTLQESLNKRGVRSSSIEIKKFKLKRNKAKRISYFLTDAVQAKTAAFWAKEYEDSYVINRNAFDVWSVKSIIQKRLHKIGISVPLPTPYSTEKSIVSKKFILKSEMHGIRRSGIFEKFLLDPWLLYTEKNAHLRGFQEYKVWSVGGQLFAKDHSILNTPLRRAIHKIHAYFGLEVLSVDLFIGPSKKFFIIDLNKAPAFFQNDQAREMFARYIQYISKFACSH